MYQYRGTQTVDRELDYLRVKGEKLETANRELTAENMILREQLKKQRRLTYQANTRVGAREAQIAKLQGIVRELKREKINLQARIIGLKKVRPYKVYEEPQPVIEPEVVELSGPRGLLAAVEEARQVRIRKAAAA